MRDSAQPLILIWPDAWPKDSVMTDLGLPAHRFTFIRPGDRRSWEYLRARGGETTVLDPVNAAPGELEALIESRGIQHAKGLDACTDILTSAINREGHFYG